MEVVNEEHFLCPCCNRGFSLSDMMRAFEARGFTIGEVALICEITEKEAVFRASRISKCALPLEVKEETFDWARLVRRYGYRSAAQLLDFLRKSLGMRYIEIVKALELPLSMYATVWRICVMELEQDKRDH